MNCGGFSPDSSLVGTKPPGWALREPVVELVAPEVTDDPAAVEPREAPAAVEPPDVVPGTVFEPDAPVDLPVDGANEPALPLPTIWLVTVAGPAVDADVQADSIRLTAKPDPDDRD